MSFLKVHRGFQSKVVEPLGLSVYRLMALPSELSITVVVIEGAEIKSSLP